MTEKENFFGQISFEYEHNANSELTEKDFRESVVQRIMIIVKMKMIGIILFFTIKI